MKKTAQVIYNTTGSRSRLRIRRYLFVAFAFVFATALGFLFSSNIKNVNAADLSQFRAGNIMSDEVMADYNSMTEVEIQAFLESKGNCSKAASHGNDYTEVYAGLTYRWNVRNGKYVCLSQERFINDGNTPNYANNGAGETAAHIIYTAAQDYKINPKVLIVLLEKEQGLITDAWPNSIQYRSATGYGCPDTAACDTKYYGLRNQVENAAWLFRYTLDGKSSMYRPGNNNVRWSPNASCGSSVVNIENYATSALYRYTPYQPNAAALRAGYGMGDGCSAYGNRNFYNYYTDWFGSTHAISSVGSGIIPNGIHNILLSVNINKAVDVNGASSANGANVQVYDRNNTVAQRFQFVHRGGNYYLIINMGSHKALDVNGASSANGANVQQYSLNYSCAQLWKVVKNSNGTYTFQNKCSGKNLDVNGASTANGTNIQIWPANSTWAQQFRLSPEPVVEQPATKPEIPSEDPNNGTADTNNQLKPSDETDSTPSVTPTTPEPAPAPTPAPNPEPATPEPTPVPTQLISDGVYAIRSAANSNMVLDVNGASLINGANVQLYQFNGTGAQRFKFVHTGGEYYTITNTYSGKRVDLNGAATNNGSNIHQYSPNTTCAQYWKAVKNTDGTFSFFSRCASNKALDICGAAMHNGTNIHLYQSNGTAAQKFRLTAF